MIHPGKIYFPLIQVDAYRPRNRNWGLRMQTPPSPKMQTTREK